ncbi:helix-turn-helix domain-containing protein [Cereibacter sphaeroides]
MQDGRNGYTAEDGRWREALHRLRLERGLTQSGLASLLGTSQSTLSRLLAKGANPRPALRLRIEKELVAGGHGGVDDTWLRAVAEAAKRSPAFFDAVSAALRIVHENA